MTKKEWGKLNQQTLSGQSKLLRQQMIKLVMIIVKALCIDKIIKK